MSAEERNHLSVNSPRRSPVPDITSPHDDSVSVMTSVSDTSTNSRFQSLGLMVKHSIQILQGQNPITGSSSSMEEEEETSTSELTVAVPVPTPEGESSEETKENRNELELESDQNRGEGENVIDFLKDDPKTMTRSRKIALKLMKTKKWYNPHLGREDKAFHPDNPEEIGSGSGSQTSKDEHSNSASNKSQPELGARVSCISAMVVAEKPSLEKAWAYFEHITLPRFLAKNNEKTGPPKNCVRRITSKFQKGDAQLDRAEPGERELTTSLYSPIFTPLKQMGDFGLGMGLYFSTLRALMIITTIAGIINIPNYMYYSGEDYSNSQTGVNALLKGSAICTNTAWVPCTDCTLEDFKSNEDRFGSVTVEDQVLNFALRNNCLGATLEQGFVNYGTLIFLLIAIVVMSLYQKKMEVAFDEDEQTAQDYSIVVTNPPVDALDPEEWRTFFKDNFDGAHVTCLTIAIDNDILVRSLVDRRECMRKLEMTLEPGTSLTPLNLARIAAKAESNRSSLKAALALFAPGYPELVGKVAVLTAKIQGLAQLNYPATRVFVTFETEKAQRNVLSKLNYGLLKSIRNKAPKDLPPNHLFRGKTVLNVQEPDEPSTIRWKDLNAKFRSQLKQLVTTTISTILAIVLVALLVKTCNDIDTSFSAIAIAVCNAIFPIFAKFLTSFESHAAEGGKQTSLYFKIAIFRLVNTAIVLTIITPFTRTLEDSSGTIPSIYAIFIADIVTTNVIQLLDPVGHLQKHVLAPRATTQDGMNIMMKGIPFELAERYTNMTKLLFLAFWYCAIYPGVFFLCSFAFLCIYFVDRFSLMRSWARTPKLGTRIAKFSRKYFFTLAISAMAVVSSYYWTGFPYDNLCVNDDETLDEEFLMVQNITSGNGNTYEVTVDKGDISFHFCQQDFFRINGTANFPAIPAFQPEGLEWMTEDQEMLTAVYGWTSVAVLGIFALTLMYGWFKAIMILFRGTYKASGDDMGVSYSEVQSINTYIPQIDSPVFSYPLLACSIEGIDEDLFDWTDSDRARSFYDLTLDSEELCQGIHVSAKNVFSKVAHWPPKK